METVKPIKKTTGEALVIRSALQGFYERGNDPQCVMVMAGESVCFNFSLDLKQGLKFTLEQWTEIVNFVEAQLDAAGDKEAEKQPSWGPDWSKISLIYKFWAVDQNGAAYVFTKKPKIDNYSYLWNNAGDGNDCECIGRNKLPFGIDWKDTLLIRPGVSL